MHAHRCSIPLHTQIPNIHHILIIFVLSFAPLHSDCTSTVQHLTFVWFRATYNLYQQVVDMQKRQRRNKAKEDPLAATAFNLDPNNTVDQLVVIVAFIHDLEAVLFDARRRLMLQLEKQGTGPQETAESPTKSRKPSSSFNLRFDSRNYRTWGLTPIPNKFEKLFTFSGESHNRSRAASAGGPVVRLQTPSTGSKAVPSPTRAIQQDPKPTPRK